MKALNLLTNQIKGGKCSPTVVSCNFDFSLERVHEGVTLIIYTRYIYNILLNRVHNEIPGSKLRNEKFNSCTLPTAQFSENFLNLRVIFWHNVPPPPLRTTHPCTPPPLRGPEPPPQRVIYGGHPKCPTGNTQGNIFATQPKRTEGSYHAPPTVVPPLLAEKPGEAQQGGYNRGVQNISFGKQAKIFFGSFAAI